MEASPRQPQHDEESVRAIGDRLVIERLEIADERAARVVRDRAQAGQPAAETITKAVEIGARVLDSEETAANVDYVRAEFERHAGGLAKDLSGALEAGNEALVERIAEAFGPDRSDSVQQQIKEIVGRANEEQRASLSNMLTAEDGSNPLVAIQARTVKAILEAEERHRQEMRVLQRQNTELSERFTQLLDRQQSDELLAEAEEAGTRKGRTFEDLVHAEIETLAGAQGDAAHHVGDASSETGGKKGDTAVEIGAASGPAQACVVFEAKNRKLSKNDAWIELNAAMAERDASFGVLIVAGDDKIPAGLEELTEYQGNKMIAVLDREAPDPLALRLVYRYVRARVLATSAEGLEVDAGGVRDAVEEANARLKAVNRIRKSLTGVTTSADRARVDLDEMIGDVERCLARIESLVAAADSD